MAFDEELRLHAREREKQVIQAEPDTAPGMSADDRREGEELLSRRDFLAVVQDDLEALGIVGEGPPAIVTYSVMTSRKLEAPLAACFKAASASGKSFIVSTVARLCPEEDLRDVSRMTPQALYYAPTDYLKHKFVIVRERPEGEEADYPIRTMLSEKGLCLWSPGKSPDGKLQFEERVVDGPMAYVETTTDIHINLENETRMIDLHLDESVEQTTQILEQQRIDATLPGVLQSRSHDGIVRRHRNAQRLLKPYVVVVPYAPLLQFPTQRTRARRDQAKLLELVKVVALCHQRNKQVQQASAAGETFEYIDADVLDYRIAYDLAATIFAETLLDLDHRSRELLAEIREMVAKRVRVDDAVDDCALTGQSDKRMLGEKFTRRDIREFIGIDQRELAKRIEPLENGEHLIVHDGGKGKAYRYSLAAIDESTPPCSLTSPDELEGLLWQETAIGVGVGETETSPA